MIALCKKMLALLLAMIMLIPLHSTSAADSKYEFDRIEVVYAAEFTVYPNSVPSDHWLTQLAGGSDKPIQLMYGILHLYSGDRYIDEQFIKMSGEGGSERFLSNSMRKDYFDSNGALLSQSSVQFWSGKKLDGTAVVKEMNQPQKSVTLVQAFDPQGNVTGFNFYAQPLIFPGDAWDPFANYVGSYTSDPNSLQHTGEVNGKEVESQTKETEIEQGNVQPVPESVQPEQPKTEVK
ncbi:hypothetical protein [Paenibacillus lignilyticus]|uniref:Secreted protein n=1 Tax=Paenibacillus lignilyticus TaxID=1172615 RepID=A0ABS5CCW0_9BACL|nr:hypothetical protein [Paenibacillus lignilyticus]MBP3963814.1 hypothetical protein [Paenibacillus lignilyticus]